MARASGNPSSDKDADAPGSGERVANQPREARSRDGRLGPTRRLTWPSVALLLAVVGVACLAGMLAALPRRPVMPDPIATGMTIVTEAPVAGLRILVTEGEPVSDEHQYMSTWTMQVTVSRSRTTPLTTSQRRLQIALDGTDYRVDDCPPDPDSIILGGEGFVDCLSTDAWPDDGSPVERTFKVRSVPGHFGWQLDDRQVRGGFPQVLLRRGGTTTGMGLPVSYSAGFRDGTDPQDYTWTPRGNYGTSSGLMEWRLVDPGSAAVRGETETPDFEGDSPAAAAHDEQRTFLAGALAGVGGGALMAAVQKVIENTPSGRKRARRA